MLALNRCALVGQALIEDPADGDAGVTLRATYIIDPKGIIRATQFNDLPVGRSVDEVRG